MAKENQKLLQTMFEWVLENKPERINEDYFILGVYKAVKKEQKKKKLRDLTIEEYAKWKRKNCGNCSKCIFRHVYCNTFDENNCWIYHKDLYSDKFLDQEIEVEK